VVCTAVCHSELALLFLLLIPPPPRSTLFPYTTLFRSEPSTSTISDVTREGNRWKFSAEAIIKNRPHRERRRKSWVVEGGEKNMRSEEHTSELQSPCNLVCRLLLEKKNKNKTEQPLRHL